MGYDHEHGKNGVYASRRGSEKYKKCEEQKYLGSINSSKRSTERDIKHQSQQHSQQITLVTAVTAVVEPILTAECWQKRQEEG